MKILKLAGGLLVLVLVAGGAGLAYLATQLAPDVELGTPCPDVAVETLDDGALELSSLRGKVVLLDFWSST
jgi:hypothetical protein